MRRALFDFVATINVQRSTLSVQSSTFNFQVACKIGGAGPKSGLK